MICDSNLVKRIIYHSIFEHTAQYNASIPHTCAHLQHHNHINIYMYTHIPTYDTLSPLTTQLTVQR